MSIGVWSIEDKSLFHRFEEAYSKVFTSIAVTSNNKYIISGSWDKTIKVWSIAEKKLILQYKESGWISSVAVTSDSKYIASATNEMITLWNLKGPGPADQPAFFPAFEYISRELCSPASEKGRQINSSFIWFSKMLHYPQLWNALNFIIFLLPDSAHRANIDFAVENKVYLSIDKYNKTQLDYVLDYDNVRNPQTEEFFAYFFKMLPLLLDYETQTWIETIRRLSKASLKVYKSFGEFSFLSVFNSLYTKEKTKAFLREQNVILPSTGKINNKKCRQFILFTDHLDLEDVDKIDTTRTDYTLDFSVIIYSSAYRFSDKRVLDLLRILAKIEDRELLSPTSQTIIDFLWKKYKKFLWIKCSFYGIALGLYISFAVTRSLPESNVASKLLIALDVCIGFIAAFEYLQITSNLSGYFTDLWNYIDMLLVSVTIIISALFWTEANEDALNFFVSTGVVLYFSKTLISFRVIDQLRNLIRMIIEVLKGMRAFLIIIISYLVAFAIIFYQSRRAMSDDSPEDSVDKGNFANDLMEIFYLIFTGGDSTN